MSHIGCKSTEFFRIADEKVEDFAFISEKCTIFAPLNFKLLAYEDTNRICMVAVTACRGLCAGGA
jgi:hypothetical protein